MVVDGKLIARELVQDMRVRVREMQKRPSLGVVIAEETHEIRSFVSHKQKVAQELGLGFEVTTLDHVRHHKTEDLLKLVLHTTRAHDGVVLQLPIPQHFDLEAVLKLFPLSHDVDVLGVTAYEQFREGRLPFLPPVVSACAEILHREGVRLQGARVLVVGEGRLVGAPAANWAGQLGAIVKSANKATEQFDAWVAGADVIISGAGVPGLIRPEHVREGVVIFDAGTSESEGVLKGDADPACAEKARVFTPTPGGIGPITVAKLFENLLTLTAIKQQHA